MKVVVFQCGNSAPYHECHLLTKKHHAHLFGTEVLFFNIKEDRPAQWMKVLCLNNLIKTLDDGDIIVYLDCDVLGINPINWTILMQGYDFRAVRNVYGVYNCGVMFWTVNANTRAAIEQIYKSGPLSSKPHYEQETITAVVEGRLKHKPLPKNYNFYTCAVKDYSLVEPIYIKAWHGFGIDTAKWKIQNELSKSTLSI